MRRRLSSIALAAMTVLALPQAAQAHLVATGMGPVYDGISHFALGHEDSLPVVALGFFAGLRGARHARVLLAVLPAAWFLGGLLAMLSGVAPPPIVLPVLTAMILLAVGGLLAANLELALWPSAAAASLLGLVRGVADLQGAEAGGNTVLTLVGMCACVFVVFALATSITLPLRRLWMIVAARVTGSWLAAAGLLLAGWIIRYGAAVQ